MNSKIQILLFFFIVSLAANSQKYDELIANGIRFTEEQKYDSAMLFFDKAKLIDSTSYRFLLNRGVLNFKIDSALQSYNDFTNTIKMYPDSVAGYFNRGILFFAAVMTDSAIVDYTKALLLEDKSVGFYYLYMRRGDAYAQKREFQSAYEDYFKAFLIDSTNIDPVNNIATMLSDLNRREEAILMFEKILRLDSNYFGAYINLGYQFILEKNYEKALIYLNKALSIYPDEPIALNNRGVARYYLQDFEKALIDINASLKLYPENCYTYRSRALVYFATNEKEKACADLESALYYGFTQVYGDEVERLQKANCNEK